MFVRSIHIRREGDFGYGEPKLSNPFRATVEVNATNGKIELLLSPEMSQRVVSLIADEIVAASRATAEAMTADVLTVTALPAPVAA